MSIVQNNFPVTFSVLSANALKDCVLSFYDIGPITACKLFYMGLNDTYVVQTVNNTYMLRAYRAGWRTLSDILFEIDMLNHLKYKGLPISTPIAKKVCHAENTGVAFIDSQYLDRHLKFLKVCTAFWG